MMTFYYLQLIIYNLLLSSTLLGNYFYSQAESLTWHFSDDIELLLDKERREVQFRSSARVGQVIYMYTFSTHTY